MANAPGHKLGQMVGDFIEKYFEGELTQICNERLLYLDVVGKVRAARRGKKVSWNDLYGNKHDLDFVIERDGTDSQLGTPAALIECAWRRYTKHSKNKAQEIQGAVLPIAEKYRCHKPFLGAILAGQYSEASVTQLNSCGFETVHFKYQDVVTAFSSVGVDIDYGETTTNADAQQKIISLEALSHQQYQQIFDVMTQLNSVEMNKFKTKLRNALDRQIIQIVIAPLYGANTEFNTIDDAIIFLNDSNIQFSPNDSELFKIFIRLVYSNGDAISGDFKNSNTAIQFLQNTVRSY